MSQTLSRMLVHIVFSTKNRADLILPELEDELYAFIGGITRNHGSPLLAAGGTANHTHLLVVLSTTCTIANLLMHIKKDSSRWIKTKDARFTDFAWQEGYGAFSVSASHKDSVITYIQNQKTHHATRSFEDEFLAFLHKYDISYDPKYIWS